MTLLKFPALLLLVLTGHVQSQVSQDVDPFYVDPTYNCPATTTCQQVCVPTAQDCPIAMQCAGNLTLCIDGTCAQQCDSSIQETPCAYDCAPVACARVIDNFDSCNNLYGSLYTAEAECGELEVTEAVTLLTFREPGFIFLYVWIAGVSAAVVLWSAFNQRLKPHLDKSVRPLILAVENGSVEEASTQSQQIGYKTHPVGQVIYILVILTLLGFQGLLAYLTIQYYAQQEAITKFGTPHFEDEEQILRMFIITWVMGIFWSFAFKWPFSIKSLFLRRCPLNQATHVAVLHVPDQETYKAVRKSAKTAEAAAFDRPHLQVIRGFFMNFYCHVNSIMTFIFSQVNERNGDENNSILVYCPVKVDTYSKNKYFMFMFRRFNLSNDAFVAGSYTAGNTLGDIAQTSQDGLTDEQVRVRRSVVGSNVIEMKKPTVIGTIFNEFCKPFYTYQNFMIWSWFPLFYYYMAIVWLVVVTSGALVVSYFQYRNDQSLYQISIVKGTVTIIRGGERMQVSQQDVVPGDVILVQEGKAYCDMVVIQSNKVLVDESALTGEATPMAKKAMDASSGSAAKEAYDSIRHKRHTILAGTNVLEADGAIAVVVATSSYSARGELIRDIYTYKRSLFKFDVEVPLVLVILFFYAIFGFCMVIYFVQDTPVYGFFYGIYVVGTILPPLLPSVFTVSVGVSDDRLSSKKIACTKPESILVAGKITRVLFDKTGTLTNQGLNFLSVRSAVDWKNGPVVDIPVSLKTCMAVCHTLTKSNAGEIIGNPVDRVMFEASKASFEDTLGNDMMRVTDDTGAALTVVKVFDFDHHRMSQSVIVQDKTGKLVVYSKGSGESLQKMCKANTLPGDFDYTLRDSAKQGIYQITVATKSLSVSSADEVDTISREDCESGLDFIGVINFKNTLRLATPDVISELRDGSVKSVMVTGDSVLTGVCIAKEAGIIENKKAVLIGGVDSDGAVVWLNELDEAVAVDGVDMLSDGSTQLAVSGDCWEALRHDDPKFASNILQHIRVFGRCTPHGKVSITTSFIEQGEIVGMCGDGGNDCGALKMAHIGIALSTNSENSEASIVAPFTSLNNDIRAVVEVLLEGRCALASALASYKFIILYGQIETINQLMNAYFLITFAEWCWVFMDGIWTITLAYTLPLAHAARSLSQTRPTASLLGLQTLASTLGVLAIHFTFTVISLAYLWHQDWFQCRKWGSTDVSNVLVIGDNYESEVIFLVTGFQYISSAVTFNFGYEFRRGWFRNYLFVALVALYMFLHFYAALVPSRLSCLWRLNCEYDDVVRSVTSSDLMTLQNPFNTTVMPRSFRIGLVMIMITNLFVVIMYEYFIVNGVRRHYAKKSIVKTSSSDSASSDDEAVMPDKDVV